MRNDCWIFDIDGTLANGSHRKHWVNSKPKNWNAWYASAHLDTPYWDIIDFMNVARSKGLRVVISTGRSEEYREDTMRWFRNYGIHCERMYMRPTGDYRDDSVVKKEMLDQMRVDGYNPLLVFDDRDRVVKMWRENGIRCLQVQEGNF
jgi:FMN phosphatase YigB (HAD superfamily)